ncbi:MAG: hypothetical protein WCR02_08870 [Sphaerochaetaceae bacterium]
MIGDKTYLCEVVATQKKGENSYYLHEVEQKEKLQKGNQGTNLHESKDSRRNTNSGVFSLRISKFLGSSKFTTSLVVDKNRGMRAVKEPPIITVKPTTEGRAKHLRCDSQREPARRKQKKIGGLDPVVASNP